MTLILAVWLWRAKRQASPYAVSGIDLYTQLQRTLALSAAIEVIPAASYIVCVALSDSAQMFFLPVLGQAQALAPLLMMYFAARRAISRAARNLNENTVSWRSPKGPSPATNMDMHEKIMDTISPDSILGTLDDGADRGSSVPVRISTDFPNHITVKTDLYRSWTASDHSSHTDSLRSPLDERPLDRGSSRVRAISRVRTL